MSFKRITVDPRVMGGVPCIRDLRIPVAVVAGMHAEGMSALQILQAFPDLADEDIQEALRFQVADAGEDDAEPMGACERARLRLAWRQARNGEGRPARDVLDDLSRE